MTSFIDARANNVQLSTCDEFLNYLEFFSMNELPDYISYENHLKDAVVPIANVFYRTLPEIKQNI